MPNHNKLVSERYMRRCLQLAKSAKNNVRSNPNVGAVLVHNEHIIGEGCHEYYGGLHAERNAFKSVKEADRHLISDATLYVSLEPCCIHSKTPPCTDIILEHNIKKVVVSVIDPNPKVEGGGVSLLEKNGVEVITGILKEEGEALIRPFIANLNQRPYVILKYAQSSDGYFGKRGKQVWLTDKYSQVLVHKWRSEVDGILIGFHTANIDNPSLTTRVYPGHHPHRFVIDKRLETNRSLSIWTDSYPTTFITEKESEDLPSYKDIFTTNLEKDNLKPILNALFKRGISRLMVEGGASTIKWFKEQNLWDEARILTTQTSLIKGIRAPMLKGTKVSHQRLENDTISIVYN